MSSAYARLSVLLLFPLVVSAATPLGTPDATRAHTAPGDALLAVQVSDEAGKPIAARLRIRGASLAERVRLGLRDRSWVVAKGTAELSLPPGHYRMFVSRGPEWSLVERRLSLTAGERTRVKVALSHQVTLSGYRAADLHVHTAHSQDAVTHGGVTAAALAAEGVGLAVATDHNHVGVLDEGIESVPGAEVTTWEPEVGHFNAFPLSSPPNYRGTSPRELLAELRANPETFVQINHPRIAPARIAYFEIGGFDGERFARDGFDLGAHGVEVYNGYDIGNPERVLALLGELSAIAARGKRLTATGGSDSHGAPGHHPGYPRTYVQTKDASGLATALKQGRAFVTNGPLLALRVEGKLPGETLVLDHARRVEVEIVVRAAHFIHVDRVELFAGDERVWSARLGRAKEGEPLAYRARARVRIGDARALHAVARGGSGLEHLLGRSDIAPLAFTNPVYLERDDLRPQHARR